MYIKAVIGTHVYSHLFVGACSHINKYKHAVIFIIENLKRYLNADVEQMM